MGVAVSYDDVVTKIVEENVKRGHEIWWTGKVRGDVDVVNVMTGVIFFSQDNRWCCRF